MKISAHDDSRIFPLLRDYLAHDMNMSRKKVECHFPDSSLRRWRDTDGKSFQHEVDKANAWNSPPLPLAA